jgi:ABC-type multidrug transport system fused ATPase/permease subunit
MNRILEIWEKSVLGRSASILSLSDKRKFLAVIVLQILLGGLDLIGVGLIGIVGSLAITGVGSKEPGNRIQWLLNQLGLADLDLQTQAVCLSLLAVSIMTLKTLLSMYFIRRITYYLSYRGANLSSILAARLLSQPLLKIQTRSSQETVFSLTSGVNSITIGILGAFVSLVSDTSLLMVMAIGLFVIDPLLSATTFILFASIALLLYRTLQFRAKVLGEKNRELSVSSNSIILEVLTSYRELIVKNRRLYYAKKIGRIRTDLAGVTAELSFMPNLSKYVFEIVIVIGSVIISAIQFLAHDASRAVATLTIFFAASTRIAPAVLRLQQSSLKIRANSGIVRTTLELIEALGLHEVKENLDHEVDFEHMDFVPSISIQGVSITYPGKSERAVDNFSLEIQPGEVVAFVGPSGAGKTTLIDIMLGIIEPDYGSVRINGVQPLIAISNWPGAISYMPQDVMISNGTVRDNVMLGFEPIPEHEARVMSALKIARLTGLVEELPRGIDEELGDRGTRISGGQRQRLGIARAVFTAPKLLVLDEATSSLDGDTEASISDSIQQIGENVTVVIIAHRLSTVINADRVIYMDKGKLIAQGSFQEVRHMVPDFDRQARLMGLE